MIKKILITSLISMASLTSLNSLAANEEISASPWTGLYLGGNGGWGFSRTAVDASPYGATAIADITPQSVSALNNGGLFGVQAGYNWQKGRMVLGIEGDFDGASMNSNSSNVFKDNLGTSTATNGLNVNSNVDKLASLRARIGTTWKSGLIYFTAGGAFEQITTTTMVSGNTASGVYGQSAAGTFTNYKPGFVLGSGIEWMTSQNWIVRGEYMYYDFIGASSNNSLPIANCATPNCGVTISSGNNMISTIRLGVNYKF